MLRISEEDQKRTNKKKLHHAQQIKQEHYHQDDKSESSHAKKQVAHPLPASLEPFTSFQDLIILALDPEDTDRITQSFHLPQPKMDIRDLTLVHG